MDSRSSPVDTASSPNRIFVLSNPLEPPCPGNPLFTPNDGETGADAALTIIWGALEYFAEPSNDADVWGMGEALLHSLDIVGLIRCDEPTPAPGGRSQPEHAAAAMDDETGGQG